MTRKIKFFSIVLLLCGFFTVELPALGDVYDSSSVNSKTTRILIVGDEDLAPLSFNKDKTGNPRGIFVDMWKLWSKKTGIATKIKLMNFSEALEEVRKGHADVVISLAASSERAAIFDLCKTNWTFPVSIYFNKDIPAVSGLEDLAGFEVGVVKDSMAAYHIARKYPEIKLKIYSSNQAMVSGAILNQVMVFTGCTYVVRMQLAKYGHSAQNQFREIERPFIEHYFSPAVRKGNQELRNIINQGFAKFSSADWQKLESAWVGQTLEDREYGDRSFYLVLGLIAVLILGAGIFVIFKSKLEQTKRNFEITSENLLKSEKEMKVILDSLYLLLCEVDVEGKILRIIPTSYEPMILPEEKFAGSSIVDFLNGKQTAAIHSVLRRSLEFCKSIPVKLHVPSGGTSYYFEGSIAPMSDKTLLVLLRNITQQKRNELLLLERECYYASLVENNNSLILVLDENGKVCFASAVVKKMLGRSAEKIIGANVLDFMHHEEISLAKDLMKRVLGNEEACIKFDCRYRHKDGRWLYIESYISNFLADPCVKGIVVNSRDITEQKKREEELMQMSFRDSMTNLANRRLLTERLGSAVDKQRRRKDNRFALLLINLDRLRVINDSLGHAVGDQVLKLVASRMLQQLRQVDTVARVEGDEFAILMEDLGDDREPIRLAEKVQGILNSPLRVEDREIFISASIGIVISNPGYETSEQVMSDAKDAVTQAKHSGRSKYIVFHFQAFKQTLDLLDMETDLRKAKDEDQLHLHFQPIGSIQDFSIVGLECLLRWDHPEKGVIPPLDFIPLSEETGLITRLGEWIIFEACAAMAKLIKEFGSEAPAFMSINISSKQLLQRDLTPIVNKALSEHALRGHQLKFEIAENSFLYFEHILTKLQSLKDLGVSLVIDDFGIGYSSLAYLNRSLFDTLKMDKVFSEQINEQTNRSKSIQIVESIIALAKHSGFDVVAKGIEEKRQWETLRKCACDMGQGYFFSKPLAFDSLLDFLHTKLNAETSSEWPSSSLE